MKQTLCCFEFFCIKEVNKSFIDLTAQALVS